MIEEIGKVVAVEPGFAWVETRVKTTCGACAANDNCGTGLVAKAFSPKPEHLRVSTPSPLSIGQSVKIGIPEQHLLSASMWLYLVPVCVLMFSALVFQALVSFEWLVILCSFLCTFASYWIISKRFKSDIRKQEFAPVFLGATLEPMMTKKHEIPLKKL
ncbi:SoxR reducing system RseC family protein [Ningiella sp. W23]|uniref:SoxR reducing system RseC family protein n=1 Tax=Ningiella sp. W23 TaxID=3023715 RepID=UPI003756F9BD